MEPSHTQPLDRPPPPPLPSKRHVWGPIGVAVLLGAGCAYVAVRNPNTTATFPACPFKAATGWDCPGCGMTRAVYSLLHLDIPGALSHNIVLVLALPFLLYTLGIWALKQTTGRTLPSIPWPNWATYVAAGAIVLFAVLRNVPSLEWLGAT